MNNHLPIGLFDSGVGGLTVVKALMNKLPLESMVYLGDSARVPYGNKSKDTIIRYSLENTSFLMEHSIKLLVIACNTASAFAADQLKNTLSIPVVDVIEAGVKKAVETTKTKKIAVLATRATTRSQIYPQKINHFLPDAEVFSIACPLLVPLIEENCFDHAATKLILKDYLKPLKNADIDTLLLGCTHYPLIYKLIQDEVGANINIIDSAETCAEVVKVTLKELQYTNGLETTYHHYYTSDDPQIFYEQAKNFLNLDSSQIFSSRNQLVS